MKLSILSLLLPVVALAAPVVEDAATLEARATNNFSKLQADFTKLYNDAVSTNNTLNEFGNNDEPSGGQALALAGDGNAIQADLDQTLKDAQGSTVLTSAQSTTLYNQVNTKILPVTTQLLANFVRHYPGLNKQGLAGTIHNDLVKQKASTQSIGKALVAKSAGPAKKKSPALTNKLVAQFTKALKTYK